MQNMELSLELLGQVEDHIQDEAIESEVAYKNWLIEEREKAARALRLAFGREDLKVNTVVSKMQMWTREDHEIISKNS